MKLALLSYCFFICQNITLKYALTWCHFTQNHRKRINVSDMSYKKWPKKTFVFIKIRGLVITKFWWVLQPRNNLKKCYQSGLALISLNTALLFCVLNLIKILTNLWKSFSKSKYVLMESLQIPKYIKRAYIGSLRIVRKIEDGPAGQICINMNGWIKIYTTCWVITSVISIELRDE